MSETPDPGYTDSAVPTFESVREKIENRAAAAAGATELDAESIDGQQVEADFEARRRAATRRLEEIRASMRGEASAGADEPKG